MKPGDIVNIRHENKFLKGTIRNVYPGITFTAIEIDMIVNTIRRCIIKSDWIFDYHPEDGEYYEVECEERKKRWESRLNND